MDFDFIPVANLPEHSLRQDTKIKTGTRGEVSKIPKRIAELLNNDAVVLIEGGFVPLLLLQRTQEAPRFTEQTQYWQFKIALSETIGSEGGTLIRI